MKLDVAYKILITDSIRYVEEGFDRVDNHYPLAVREYLDLYSEEHILNNDLDKLETIRCQEYASNYIAYFPA